MAFAVGNAFCGEAVERTLGIDPGLNRTGYAVLDRTSSGPRLVEGGLIRSTTSLTLPERVHEIGTGIGEVLDDLKPQVVAIEQLFSHVQNPRTALLMAHARGAILFAVANRGIPIVDYAPRQMKKLLTGNGAASKEQVQRAVQGELGLETILEPNDVADAVAIALCHYHSTRLADNVLENATGVRLKG